MKKKLFFLALLALSFFTLASCFENKSTNYADNSDIVFDSPETQPSSDTTKPEDKKDDTSDKDKEIVKPTEKTESEIRVELISNANSAISSLSSNNFTVKIDNNIYKINNSNLDINGKIYQYNTNNYYVYELKNSETNAYSKEETTDLSFKNINVGSWTDILTISNQMELNRVDVNKNEAYIVKKETAFPEFLISYTDNGFKLIKDDEIEFYNIGTTEIIIPTNIYQEEKYIIKDGKFNLINLKSVLTDWINGENKDNMNVFYDSASRNLVDIKLININNGALEFYAEAAAKSGNVYLSHVTFISEDVNNEFAKTNLKEDDLKAVLYEQNSLSIDYDSVFLINNELLMQEKVRTKNILAKDSVDVNVDDILFVYETTRTSTNITYGDGINYKTAFCLKDGRYFEYTVGTLSKADVLENSEYWDAIKTKNENVLIENIDLYK